MKLAIKKATTDVTVYIFVQNSSVTTGAGLTGLAFNTASLTAYYVRPLGNATQITLATQTVTGAHSDGGFVEVSSSNMPGVYRVDLPDAVCATGVNSVVVMLKGATNMAPVLLEIQLTSLDLNDSVRAGLTALPNAAADAAGGLPISDAGGLDLDAQIGTDIDAILVDTNALNDTKIPDTISLAAINAEADTALADYDPPTNAELVARTLAAAAYFDHTTDTVALSATTEAQIDAIEADTNELQTDDVPGLIAALNDLSAAEVNTEVDTALADIHLDHLLAADYDPASKPGTGTALLNEIIESDAGVSRFTANALEQAPTGGSAPSAADIRTEIDANSTQLAAIVADTNELQGDWTDGGRLDLIIDAILADTNELQGDDVPGLIAALDLLIDGILEDTGTTIPAQITALNNLSAAQVNAEVVDALATDTYAEPGSVPAATATLAAKVGWLYVLARNKVTQTSTTQTLRNDADGADIATSTVSDDSTTAIRGEWT